MSTRSTIAYHNPNTHRVEQVYCHFDGYLDGVGRTLLNHYDNESAAMNVVREGDMSSLAETMNESLVYCRDRGDKWIHVKPDVYESLDEYLFRGDTQEYNYVFTNGEWYLVRSRDNLVPLKELIR